MEVLVMAAWDEQKVLDHPKLSVLRWKNSTTLSGSDLSHEPGLDIARAYQPERCLSQPGLG